MINVEDKQRIKDDVQNCFIERNNNTISEKISDCVEAGFTEDEARHAVIQVVKNLSSHLLPLKMMSTKEEVCGDFMQPEDLPEELQIDIDSGNAPTYLCG